VDETERGVARQKAREILAKMRTDPAFVQQLRDDPRGTLAAAGMPATFLGEAVDGLGLGSEDEAAGHGVQWSRPSSRVLATEGLWAEAAQEEAEQKAE
jgi:hypothetical protein